MINQKEIEELEINVEESAMVASAKEQTEQVNAKEIQRLKVIIAIILEDIKDIKVSARTPEEQEHVVSRNGLKEENWNTLEAIMTGDSSCLAAK